MKNLFVLIGTCLLCALARGEDAANTPTVEAATPAPAAPAPKIKVIVILPEQVDQETFFYIYSETAQHIVQTKVEQALIRAGFEVVDLATIQEIRTAEGLASASSDGGARTLATGAGAAYAIVGRATAVKASQGEAYGVNVVRSTAEITARILNAADGTIVETAEASAQKGGQASRAAGQEALKTAGDQIARKIASALKQATTPKP